MLPEPLSRLPPRVREAGWWWEPAFSVTAVLLGMAGFLGATWVGLQAFGATLNFGRGSTPGEVAESRRLFGLAAIIAAGVPTIGLLLALCVRHRGVAIYFAALLVFGGSFAGLVAVDADRNREPDALKRGPHVCQDFSGGDSRCPGG